MSEMQFQEKGTSEDSFESEAEDVRIEVGRCGLDILGQAESVNWDIERALTSCSRLDVQHAQDLRANAPTSFESETMFDS